MPTSLLSPEFLLLAPAAIVVSTALRGVARQLLFLSINLLFLFGLLPLSGFLSTLFFCVLGFVLAKFASSWPRWASRLGVAAAVAFFVYMRNYDFLKWLLPGPLLTNAFATVGLSFMFFKMLHIVIEARSGTLGHLGPLTYLNYCFNFTTFMMGPIQRFQDYRSQWHGEKEAVSLTFDAHLGALVRILVGLIKAYVLAAWLEPFAMDGRIAAAHVSTFEILTSIYAFYFYLYLNFAGYCDVAIGVGSLMGIRPPENFDRPFLATNISDFWLRQHRSLTLWLTDYIFSPLYKVMLGAPGFSSRPLLAANVCLIATMLVSGLWHGTTLSFLVFGMLHGAFLIIYRTWDATVVGWIGRPRVRQWRQRWDVRLSGIVLTFHAAAFAFVFFRLDVAAALKVYSKLLGL